MRPLLAYYGDDLTGSTDVMEALATHGVPTVLFTKIPPDAQLQPYADRRAIGLAGSSRSETPQWMDEHLPAAFGWLKGLGPELCHYKVCSTFDSSPQTGSIGRALDIGAAIFGQTATPVVVGAPQLRRYTCFGNLFADFRGETYRIDRHPVMSRHPVTPMAEANLRRHLALQTRKTVGLVDFVQLGSASREALVDRALEDSEIVLIDVVDADTQALAGAQLWRLRGRAPFVAGSSGVEYALVTRAAATPLSGERRAFAAPGPRGPIAVVSGSCSPTTARQIEHVGQRGFATHEIDPARLAGPDAGGEVERMVETARRDLGEGRSPLFYTALGSETLDATLAGKESHIGVALGRVLDALVSQGAVERAVVAGGDTSSHAVGQIGAYALEFLYPLAPGSPLCAARLESGRRIELAFKGGQIGGDDYFVTARDA